LPENPGLHAQVREPAVLVHTALGPQPPLLMAQSGPVVCSAVDEAVRESVEVRLRVAIALGVALGVSVGTGVVVEQPPRKANGAPAVRQPGIPDTVPVKPGAQVIAPPCNAVRVQPPGALHWLTSLS